MKRMPEQAHGALTTEVWGVDTPIVDNIGPGFGSEPSTECRNRHSGLSPGSARLELAPPSASSSTVDAVAHNVGDGQQTELLPGSSVHEREACESFDAPVPN